MRNIVPLTPRAFPLYYFYKQGELHMKKSILFSLVASALLALSACGGNPAPSSTTSADPGSSTPGGQTSTNPPATSTAPGTSETQPESTTSEPPVTSTEPLEEEDANIAFNEVADNVMVSPKIKAYLDAMHEQEKTLQYPYRLTALYGPENFGAPGQDRDDNYKGYTEDELGGVDVCTMLNRNDYSGKTENYPIRVSWEKGNLEYTKAYIRVWSKSDKSDERIIPANSDLITADLPNLYANTTYKYQLLADGAKRYVSQEATFTTADYVRTISMGGVPNIRDMGGYKTSYGKRIKQGLIYRGYEIIDESFSSHGANYNENVEKVNKEVMKIAHEIDLKDSGGRNGRTVSCLTTAAYHPLEVVAYDSFFGSTSQASVPQIFELLSNADKEHVYFHCWGGADRTGMIAFFLNAILGVSYTDLVADFELTTETNNKRCHMHNSSNAHFPKFLDAFTKRPEFDKTKTVNVNAENVLVNFFNVPRATIEKIRSIMLEGYEAGITETEPTYTPKAGAFAGNDLGHWHEAEENANVRCDWGRHNLVVDAEHTQEADCAHEGHIEKVCSVCEKRVVTETPKGAHNYKVEKTVANADGNPVTLGTCAGCGDKEIAIAYTDGVTYKDGVAQSSVSTKMANDGKTNTAWHINVDKAITGAKIYFEGKTDSSGNMNRYFFNQAKPNPFTGETVDNPGNPPDDASEADWRYSVQIGDGAKIYPNVQGTYTEAGCGAGPFYFADIDLKAGDNVIRLWQEAIGYRLTFSGKVHIMFNSDATIVGEEIVPPDPSDTKAVYPTFKWSDAITEDSATLDSGKFKQSSNYIFRVKGVPATGTYVLTIPLAGNSNGTDYVIGSDGQAFTVKANDVAGTVLVTGKSYGEIGLTTNNKEFFDVAFAEVNLEKDVVNTIVISVGSTGGYRLSVNANGNMSLAAK